MNALKMIFALYVGSLASVAAADDEPLADLAERFSLVGCQHLLRGTSTIDADAIAKGEAIYQWITFRHPVVRSALMRTNRVDSLWDLFFLSKGFAWPPANDSFIGRRSRAQRMWDARVSVDSRSATVSSRALARHDLNDVLKLLRDPESSANAKHRDRRDRVTADLITRSLLALSELTRDSYVETLAIGERETFIRGWFASATIKVPSFFTEDELGHLRRDLAALRTFDVRVYLARRVATSLPQMLKEHYELCAAWNQRPTAAAMIVELISQLGITARPVARLAPAAASGPAITAVPRALEAFDATSIDEFLVRRSAREVGRPEDIPLLEIHDELREVTDLLLAALMQAQAWRAFDVNWQSLAELVRADGDDLDSLRRHLAEARLNMGKALGEIEAAIVAIGGLAEWIEGSATFLERSGLENAAPSLSPHKQALLGSILTMHPAMTTLVASSRGSLHERYELVRKTIDAIFDVQLLLADLTQARVRESGARRSIEESPAFAKLRETLNDFAVKE